MRSGHAPLNPRLARRARNAMNFRNARNLRPGQIVTMKDWIPVRRGVILSGPKLENKNLYFQVRLDDGEILEAVHLMF